MYKLNSTIAVRVDIPAPPAVISDWNNHGMRSTNPNKTLSQIEHVDILPSLQPGPLNAGFIQKNLFVFQEGIWTVEYILGIATNYEVLYTFYLNVVAPDLSVTDMPINPDTYAFVGGG